MSTAAVGRIESWRSDTGSYLDETPIISLDPEGPESRVIELRAPEQTPVLGIVEEAHAYLRPRWSWERVWIPWAFEPSPYDAESGVSVGVLVGEATSSFHTVWSTVAEATRVLPATGVFHLISPVSVAVSNMMTPLWEEASSVIVRTPGFAPRMLRLLEPMAGVVDPLARDPRAVEAASAMFDLMRWLNRSRDEVADICRVATRTSQYWATGKKPRPATVRRLYELHAFVGSLVRALGKGRARQWLDEESEHEGPTRLEVLATKDGLASVIREASPLLFVEAARGERPRPESMEDEEIAQGSETFTPVRVEAAPRRPRRPPHHAT